MSNYFSKVFNKNKKAVLISLGIVAVLVILYFAGVVFYHDHYLPRTLINTSVFSNKTSADANDFYKEMQDSYTLEIADLDGKTDKVVGKDIDLKYSEDNELAKILRKQNEWSWPISLFRPNTYDDVEVFEYSTEKAASIKAGLNAVTTANTKNTTNAYPVYEGGKIIVKPEVQGNTLNNTAFDKKYDQVLACGIEKLNMKADGCYVKPAYVKDSKEVSEAKQAMEKSLGAIVTYSFNENNEVIDKDRIGSWLTVDENMKLSFNRELMNNYLAELAGKYETTDGTSVHTIDKEAEINALIPILQAGKPVSREAIFVDLPVQTSNYTSSNARIDVNLSTQTLTLYIDNAVDMTSPIVSGCVADGNSTATGVFYIYSKATDTYLQGPTWYDYVNYWMAYDRANANGIHDADGWRSEYGGTIYQNNGSHGCINVPVWAAARLYNTCGIGTEVNVHW